MKNICIFGLGYVGSALAAMLSADYNVFAYDIDEDKLNKLKNKISPIKDRDIQKTLKNESLNLHPTNNKNHLKDCDYALICTPTNFLKMIIVLILNPLKMSLKTLVKLIRIYV